MYETDAIDVQILSNLLLDARYLSAPDAAAQADVTAGTIRNRIDKLESNGVIEGYETRIDYHRLGFLPVLFVCTILPDEYGSISQKVGQHPAVTRTQIVHSGSHNFHVVAIANCQSQITAIQNNLVEFDIEIESVSLINTEEKFQFSEFGDTEEDTHDKP
ncbi:Lrp/AsnC family transcriptional regulator [Haloarcula argentinensis]|uniref:Lrp/AsnC family transcriptional regulator n=1 Tax=Haloarcula argentinensis TaxID=43776 RepID=UPI00166BC2E9|nr:winged helix-turn-helix transcriptional regulator [Haloarcula argentinensis]